MKWRVLENQISPGHLFFFNDDGGKVVHYYQEIDEENPPPAIKNLPYLMRLSQDSDGDEEPVDYILIACDDISSQEAFHPLDVFEGRYGVVLAEVYEEKEDKWEAL